MSNKEHSPHETWCDTQNNISERCNCMVSTYIEKIEELNEQADKLAAALDCVKEGYYGLHCNCRPCKALAAYTDWKKGEK